MRDRSRFQGCLIGGAAGDALGYAVEFLREDAIFRKYGRRGITEYALCDGTALISDDTQMTLFTANGLLAADARQQDYISGVRLAYLDWLTTQDGDFAPHIRPRCAWLANRPELYSSRAPGNTCLSALIAGGNGTPESPINNSKGCGGVMRMAPIGLYFNESENLVWDVCRLGAAAAALTHGHPLGWLPGAAMAVIVYDASQNDFTILDAVRDSLVVLNHTYSEYSETAELTSLIERAIDLSRSIEDDLDAIHMLGEGWTGDEALAIAVFCALRYAHDFSRAITAAVNHNGDSDSTGAITGNILGAKLGIDGIPPKFLRHLELAPLIMEVADDLWHGVANSNPTLIDKKYISLTYGR